MRWAIQQPCTVKSDALFGEVNDVPQSDYNGQLKPDLPLNVLGNSRA